MADVFKMEIQIGNAEMNSAEDVAVALQKVANSLETQGWNVCNEISDVNGNRVGEWEKQKYYVHKFSVGLQYGGPEEGGWWYDTGFPVESCVYESFDEEDAYEKCRALNDSEHERAEKEEKYGYTSVLAHQSDHYAYSVETDPEAKAYPEERPHYE